MVIDVSVQYNGGFLPEMILLTLCDYIGEPFPYHVEFFVHTANVPTYGKPFDFSAGLAAFRFFLKQLDFVHHPLVFLCKKADNSAGHIQRRKEGHFWHGDEHFLCFIHVFWGSHTAGCWPSHYALVFFFFLKEFTFIKTKTCSGYSRYDSGSQN